MKNKNANFEHLTAIVDAFYEEPSLMLLMLCVLDVLMRPYFISTDLPHIVINFILTNKNMEVLWAHDIQTGFMGAGMLYESQLREKTAQKEEK